MRCFITTIITGIVITDMVGMVGIKGTSITVVIATAMVVTINRGASITATGKRP